ncbi:MAG TPA: hypothetical protein VKB93_03305 [Thermoanaerobaculia bacterium]|nr:hypothetical protein [Thermoanaerobaculia bacterium]
MKATAALALFLLAAPAFAQDTSADDEATPAVDYSRPTLLRIVVEAQREEDRRGFRFEDGSVTFRALGTNWHFVPIMLPFVGTRFTTTREWPDAFSLTGTPIATSPRAWARRREFNAEMKRIERVTKPKAKVKVNVKSD